MVFKQSQALCQKAWLNICLTRYCEHYSIPAEEYFTLRDITENALLHGAIIFQRAFSQLGSLTFHAARTINAVHASAFVTGAVLLPMNRRLHLVF